MAKKNEETAVATQDNQIAVIGNENVDVLSLCEEVSRMSEGAVISSEYWTPEVGEVHRVVFAGLTDMKAMNAETDDDRVQAVKLLMVEGKEKGLFKKNADKVLVSTLRDLKVPTPVVIECTGKEKGKKGSYKTFTVKALS